MPAQIVFISLFLGLLSGTQPVRLLVSGPVRTVRILLDGRQVTAAVPPEWSADVDFGSELTPRELTAVGLDADGAEIARATQIVNLPRPTAEFDIVLQPG